MFKDNGIRGQGEKMKIMVGFNNPFESYFGVSGKYFNFILFEIKLGFHKDWTIITIILFNFYILIDGEK
ncbi:hypothetical protein CCP3SC1AL1_2900002 [Gammaproteobacteria bacterium]